MTDSKKLKITPFSGNAFRNLGFRWKFPHAASV
ncbi:MAG: hypothetical protein JW395_4021 [Nitrospira sp.]|nr:hypothetical protein [Nitrospira sp.]